jgi:hypothetical protein
MLYFSVPGYQFLDIEETEGTLTLDIEETEGRLYLTIPGY